MSTIKYYWKQKSVKNDIGVTLYSDAFLSILKQYLEVPSIKKDWLGRLYCVVNPNLNDRGQFDINKIIYEVDSNGYQYSNTQYVENWLTNKLRIIQDLFKQRRLFSQLNFYVEHVGPQNQDNFLVVVEPLHVDEFKYWFSNFRTRLLIDGALAALIVLFINII